MEGYIKLYRKMLNSQIFNNEKTLKIWVWCLLKASHQERNQLVGQQLVNLKSGEFIFGRKKASEELNINENTVYKHLKVLEKLQMCTIKSNNKFSIVSINNWEFYQAQDIKNNINFNNKRTTKEQQRNNRGYIPKE